jgi:hypothetical protein
MSYLTQNEIASNSAMFWRVAQAAAEEGVEGNPDEWTNDNRRYWAAAPGWDDAWESFKVSNPDADPGANEAVITDGQILAQVQAMNPPA